MDPERRPKSYSELTADEWKFILQSGLPTGVGSPNPKDLASIIRSRFADNIAHPLLELLNQERNQKKAR